MQHNALNISDSNKISDTTNNNITDQENYNSHESTQSQILYKCKLALERLNFEVEEERKLTTNFKVKNDELMKNLSRKDNELCSLNQKVDIINSQFQKNIDIIKTLQHENSYMKENSFSANQSFEQSFNNMRGSIIAKENEARELKTHIIKLEKSLTHRDYLIDNWSNTINDLDHKLIQNDDD